MFFFFKFQANYSGHSGQNTNYPLPTQSSRPGGQTIQRSANDNYQASLAPGGQIPPHLKRSTNDNYQASLAPGGQINQRSTNDNYRASLAPGRNSGGNSNKAPLGSVENRGQKRSLGSSGKLLNPNWTGAHRG